LRRLSPKERSAVTDAAARYGRFANLPVELSIA